MMMEWMLIVTSTLFIAGEPTGTLKMTWDPSPSFVECLALAARMQVEVADVIAVTCEQSPPTE